jgi:microcystin-dependent protein
MPYNFAPTGWAPCNGQILPISQNTALFSLLGTYYGGDGKSTFALPNLEGSVPIHQGQGKGLSLYDLGQQGGSDTVTLIDSEMPFHTHSLVGSKQAAVEREPGNQQFAKGAGIGFYDTNAQPTTTLAFQFLGPAGSTFPHNNMQPYLGVQFCIALQGVFPPRG